MMRIASEFRLHALQAAVEYWHHRRISCHFSNSRLMNMRRMLPMVGQIKTLLIDREDWADLHENLQIKFKRPPVESTRE